MPEWLWLLIALSVAFIAFASLRLNKKPSPAAPKLLTFKETRDFQTPDSDKPELPLTRPDVEVDNLKARFERKIYVEILKTKINRHKVFWVGRSHIDNTVRVGVEFSNGRKYFFDWDEFQKNPRHSDFKLMTPEDADALEEKIKTECKSSSTNKR